jgi:glucoamylase
MPLVWAHAEYVTLLRSIADGQVFDYLPAVAERYQKRHGLARLEIWKPNRHARSIKPGWTLRVQGPTDFVLHWTDDAWQRAVDTRATTTALGIYFVDIPISAGQRAPIRFTFYWPGDNRWEGRDYAVCIDCASG